MPSPRINPLPNEKKRKTKGKRKPQRRQEPAASCNPSAHLARIRRRIPRIVSPEPYLSRNPRSFALARGFSRNSRCFPLGGFLENRWGFRFVSRRVRGCGSKQEKDEQDGREGREGADRREDGRRHGQGEEAARHPVLARWPPGRPSFSAIQIVCLAEAKARVPLPLVDALHSPSNG